MHRFWLLYLNKRKIKLELLKKKSCTFVRIIIHQHEKFEISDMSTTKGCGGEGGGGGEAWRVLRISVIDIMRVFYS